MRFAETAFLVIVPAALATAGTTLHAQELSDLCPDADVDNAAAVVGQVRDVDSGVVLPGARVVAFWGEAEALGNVRGKVGADGSYTLCGLPQDVELELSASFVGFRSPPVTVTCPSP
ncbi:MAG: carboxypeptidase-like regulatory domain-containing protein [Gemmatimonadota bacterium]